MILVPYIVLGRQCPALWLVNVRVRIHIAMNYLKEDLPLQQCGQPRKQQLVVCASIYIAVCMDTGYSSVYLVAFIQKMQSFCHRTKKHWDLSKQCQRSHVRHTSLTVCIWTVRNGDADMICEEQMKVKTITRAVAAAHDGDGHIERQQSLGGVLPVQHR